MKPAARTRSAVGAALAVAGIQLWRFWSLDRALDDAWISFRVARTWLEGGGLTFDPSRPPVEGMTNLLWTLLSASWIAAFPAVDPIVCASILGAILHLGTVGLAAQLAGRVGGGSWRAAAVTGLLLASSGSMAFYAHSGPETPLWTFLFVLALDRLERRAWVAAGLALGALAMTRPEGVLVAGLLSLAALPRSWRVGAVVGVLIGGMELFRWHHYGALVPNTFFAKAPEPMAGLEYLAGFGLWGLGVLGPLAVLPATRRPAGRVLLALVLVLLAGAAWSGGDWMPGWRRCSLALVGLAILAGASAGLATPGWGRRGVVLGVGAWMIGATLAAIEGKDSAVFPHEAMADLGRRAAATPGVDAVALVDIGRFGWAFQGRIVDLVGLTDAHLAHLPGGHADKPWDEDWFRAAAPDLLIARSSTPITDPLEQEPVLGRPEKGMVLSVLNHGGYRLHAVSHPAEEQWLMIFAREDLALPAALWGPPVERDLPELLRARGG